ncbi:uncharacterized protein DNG_04831 [Cephalotrichum gorgonifer]|uniref:Uncharacterized protein n=1 Tax=Cephalotrichum gorgonifer TaxID=2041049 RepID=A0AAE8SUX5_9PEZI|nr:uncharacterized protein DNG_04831 [Cephalotrichum gorgonifer]
MHPAPSLAEAPPKTDEYESRSPAPHAAHGGGHGGGPAGATTQQSPPTPSQQPVSVSVSLSVSPPLRTETPASLPNHSPATSPASAAARLSVDPAGNSSSYGAETSPNLHQSIFSVTDGSDLSNHRRATRRRTGPLSQQQREKAALIRKLGACPDCRRRRVACHPSHHNLTWEDAVKKYHRPMSPNMQEIAPLGPPRPISPAPLLNHTHQNQNHIHHVSAGFKGGSADAMDIDPAPVQPSSRSPPDESRLRTPLPSGKPPSIPGIDSLRAVLETHASRIFATPHRGRYAAAQVLLLYWQDDDDPELSAAVQDLADVFDKQYRYTFQKQKIPIVSDECRNPWRWLSQQITAFADDRDQRDVLKILYYNGHSYLDRNRQMALASSRDTEKATTIRWSGIQQILEEACSDTLIIMDAAYFPSPNVERKQGVLELIAAASSEEHFRLLDRCAFTRALTEELRSKARGPNNGSLTAAHLHAKLMSTYPKMIQDKNPGNDYITSFPAPLHLQITGNPRLPSIQLCRLHRTSLPFAADHSGPQIQMSMRLKDDFFDIENWAEWLRVMPEGVRDVRVEGQLPLLK